MGCSGVPDGVSGGVPVWGVLPHYGLRSALQPVQVGRLLTHAPRPTGPQGSAATAAAAAAARSAAAWGEALQQQPADDGGTQGAAPPPWGW